jgi:hypothetical protein
MDMRVTLKVGFLISLLALATLFQFSLGAKAHHVARFWVVFIVGTYEFSKNADIFREILVDYYNPDDVFYQRCFCTDNARNALTGWLAERSELGDLVLIFFSCHGGGYDINNGEIKGGRIDENGDEGLEHYNETSCSWFGVDECLFFDTYDRYWDDQMKGDLAEIKYGRMIVCFDTGGSNETKEGPVIAADLLTI